MLSIWVGGSKKGLKIAYVVFKWSLRRFSRILPVYYLCLFLGTIMLNLLPLNGQLHDSFVCGGDLLLSIFLMQRWSTEIVPPSEQTNIVDWTVSTLFFFYLVYPRYSLLFYAIYSACPSRTYFDINIGTKFLSCAI